MMQEAPIKLYLAILLLYTNQFLHFVNIWWMRALLLPSNRGKVIKDLVTSFRGWWWGQINKQSIIPRHLLGSLDAQRVGAPGTLHLQKKSIIYLVPYGLSTSINAQSFLGPASGLVGLGGGSDMAPWRRQLFMYLSLEDEGETTKEDCKEEHAMGRKKRV